MIEHFRGLELKYLRPSLDHGLSVDEATVGGGGGGGLGAGPEHGQVHLEPGGPLAAVALMHEVGAL